MIVDETNIEHLSTGRAIIEAKLHENNRKELRTIAKDPKKQKQYKSLINKYCFFVERLLSTIQ